MPKFLHYAIVLSCVCLASALGLAGTYVATQKKIALRNEEKLNKSLAKVLPQAKTFKKLEATQGEGDVYEGRDAAGKLVGYAAIGFAQGYSSKIQVLVGLKPDLSHPTIVAIDIVNQQETPGLGANVAAVSTNKTLWSALGLSQPLKNAKPSFKDQFQGKAVAGLQVGSTVDAITGATISSRAVVRAVKWAGVAAQKALGLKITIDGVTGATTKSAHPAAGPQEG